MKYFVLKTVNLRCPNNLPRSGFAEVFLWCFFSLGGGCCCCFFGWLGFFVVLCFVLVGWFFVLYRFVWFWFLEQTGRNNC